MEAITKGFLTLFMVSSIYLYSIILNICNKQGKLVFVYTLQGHLQLAKIQIWTKAIARRRSCWRMRSRSKLLKKTKNKKTCFFYMFGLIGSVNFFKSARSWHECIWPTFCIYIFFNPLYKKGCFGGPKCHLHASLTVHIFSDPVTNFLKCPKMGLKKKFWHFFMKLGGLLRSTKTEIWHGSQLAQI